VLLPLLLSLFPVIDKRRTNCACDDNVLDDRVENEADDDDNDVAEEGVRKVLNNMSTGISERDATDSEGFVIVTRKYRNRQPTNTIARKQYGRIGDRRTTGYLNTDLTKPCCLAWTPGLSLKLALNLD
jgi:hypothetical protein